MQGIYEEYGWRMKKPVKRFRVDGIKIVVFYSKKLIIAICHNPLGGIRAVLSNI